MEGQLEYLFAGFAVFWAGLLAYLVWLQARLRALQAEVLRLEERLAEEVPATEVKVEARSASSARVAPEGGA